MDPRDEVIDIDEAPTGALTTAQRGNQVARQDFGGQSLATTSGATEALVAKARASVEACVIAAKRWPRNMLDSRQRILEDCRRPDFAKVAMYARPVGGGAKAEGLSIRFAEAALRAMGNMSSTSETIYDDAAVRIVRVQVVDYETNAQWSKDLSIPKTVERKQLKRGQRPLAERVNSGGERVFIVEASDDDLATKEAALISKASRTCILRLIPGDIQDEAKRMIREVASKADAKDPLGARNRMLDSFSMIGVKPSQIEAWLGHEIDTISPDEGAELRELHAAIKERETSWSEALAQRIADREDAKPKAPPAPVVAPAPQAAPQPAQEPRPERPPPVSRTSSGKGTSAVKGALVKPAPAPQSTLDDALVEPNWMRNPELPPGTPPPAEGDEYRSCAGCQSVIEVLKTEPPGAQCEVCRQA